MKKRVCERIMTSVLVMILVVSAGCTTAYASALPDPFGEKDQFEGPSWLEYESLDENERFGFTLERLSFNILNDNTKIRSGASEKSDTLYTLNAGTEVIVTGAVVNSYDHIWFILEDGGYVYCRNVSFDMKKNTLTEYYALQRLREYKEDPDELFYSQGALLVALFIENGGKYFYNTACSYASDLDYTIVTDHNCMAVSPESMRYIFFGYLAARIGFNKRDTVVQASRGEALKRVYDNAMDSINQLMKDTVFNSSPMMSDWVNIAYNTISAYETLRDANEDIEFVENCKKNMCVSDENRKLISIGYDLGVADRD